MSCRSVYNTTPFEQPIQRRKTVINLALPFKYVQLRILSKGKDPKSNVSRMASGHFFWAIFYFACLCSASLANNAKVNFREKEKKILDQILGAGKYDARIRPSGINGTGIGRNEKDN
uniref:Uncharacterized protein n=1 Tax=Anopheles stephensi TaxID=30069 RepID=A0A182Y594_ANOST